MARTRDETIRLYELMRTRNKMLASQHLSEFLLYADTTYKEQWFHKIIANHCQKLYEGEIKNLMVFLPPQHGKSEIISRKFPAWALGRDPNTRIVGCSYSSSLAEGFSRSIQRTIDSREYQEIFPNTFLNGTEGKETSRGYLRNADYFDCVNHHGFYKAVGVCGGLTGTPVDIAIIDDPIKDALEANSPTYRERVWEWYNAVLLTRLHNNSKQLFIMTRWHEDDLAGRILAKQPDKWTVLSIPAICEVEKDGGLSNRHIGEALWEERHSIERLLEAKSNAPREFSALYQQHPTIEGGNIFKRDWFKVVTMQEFRARRFQEPVHFYLDTAYNKKKAGKDNDPSGIMGACRIGNDMYIVKAQKMYKEMPDLLKILPEFMVANFGDLNKSKLCVEPKSCGESVVQMFEQYSSMNVKRTPCPTDSKETRAMSVSPRVECGRVYIVEGDWNAEFLDECCGFPNTPHDEFVDILGYAINDLLDTEQYDFSGLDKSYFGL